MHPTPSPRRRRRRPTVETIVEEKEEDAVDDGETVITRNNNGRARRPVEAPPVSNRSSPRTWQTTATLLRRQLSGLLWKEFLVQQRQYGWTLVELLSPALLVWLVSLLSPTRTTQFEAARDYTLWRIELPLTLETSIWQRLQTLLASLSSKHRHTLKSLWQMFETGGRRRRRLTEIQDTTLMRNNSTTQLARLDAILTDVLQRPMGVPSLQLFVQLSGIVQEALVPDSDLFEWHRSRRFQRYRNLVTLGRLHVAPNTTQGQQLVQYLEELLLDTSFPYDTVPLHETADAAVESLAAETNVWALLDVTDLPTSYTIRMDPTVLPSTSILYSTSRNNNKDYQMYYTSGYLTLQNTMDQFLTTQPGTSQETIDCLRTIHRENSHVLNVPMPNPSRTISTSYNSEWEALLFGLLIATAYLMPICRTLQRMVQEKETQWRNVLYVSGVRPWVYHSAQLLAGWIRFGVASVLVALVLRAYVFVHSSTSLLVLWMVVFGLSLTSFCRCVGALFQNTERAIVWGSLLMFMGCLPHFLFWQTNKFQAVTLKKVASLLPQTCLGLGIDLVFDLESSGQGLHFDNWSDGGYHFVDSLQFLAIDAIVYWVLAWYLDKVFSQRRGDCESFCRRSWFPCRRTAADAAEDQDDEHEPFSEESHVSRVQLRGLGKRYARSSPLVLENLDFEFCQDHVTAIVGPNGAGKSTLLKLIMGLLSPSTGDCTVNGLSVGQNGVCFRTSIGYCPQEDVLIGCLTVREHIFLFLKVRGVVSSERLAQKHAREVGLREMYLTRVGSMSKGNRQRLSVALARCGDPQVMILDAPTSNMDAKSRRLFWKCLRRDRIGRTIIVTSHDMSEADSCTRVAILKNGVLRVSGSPSFLKRRYNLGYRLSILLHHGHATTRLCDQYKNRVLHTLECLVPGVEPISNLGNCSLVVQVPRDSGGSIPKSLEALDELRGSLGIEGYRVEYACLDQVDDSLRRVDSASWSSLEGGHSKAVTVGAETQIPEPSKADPVHDVHTDGRIAELSCLSQLLLLLWKRFTIQRRNLVGMFLTILAPAVAVALVLTVLDNPVVASEPVLVMSTKAYPDTAKRVLFGGGAGLRRRLTKKRDTAARVTSLCSAIAGDDDNGRRCTHHTNIVDSSEMSSYLLNATSYWGTPSGAIVLNDLIRFHLVINWTHYEVEIEEVFTKFRDTAEKVDLGMSDGDLKDLVYWATGFQLDPDFSMDQITVLVRLFAIQLSSVDIVTKWLPKGNLRYGKSTLPNQASIMHDTNSPHAIAIWNKLYYDALYRSCSGHNNHVLAKARNSPLPSTTQQTMEANAMSGAFASLVVTVPLLIVPGAFVAFQVKERQSKARHLQLMSGSNLSTVLLSSYLYDLLHFWLLIAAVLLTIFLCGGTVAEIFLSTPEKQMVTGLLLTGFSMSVLPFSYLIARGYRNPFVAQIATIGIVFVTGFVAVSLCCMFDSWDDGSSRILRRAFRVLPSFNLGEAMFEIGQARFRQDILLEGTNAFDFSIARTSIVLLYSLTVPYSLLLLWLEGAFLKRFLRKLWSLWEVVVMSYHSMTEHRGVILLGDDSEPTVCSGDCNMLEEEQRRVTHVERSGYEMHPVVFHNVWKVHMPPNSGVIELLVAPLWRAVTRINRRIRIALGAERSRLDSERRLSSLPSRALRGATFAVNRGESLVLLGGNGCGKSTASDLAMGWLSPTCGTVTTAGLENRPLSTDNECSRARIGICPQQNPLLEGMTCRETLTFYACLRGTPKRCVDSIVAQTLERISLSEFSDVVIETLSNGHRRVLSVGVALMDHPAVLLLDDPTTGIDVCARERIYRMITVARQDCAVLATTHSKQEASFLASRTALVSGGRLFGLGSLHHLMVSRVMCDFTPCSDISSNPTKKIFSDSYRIEICLASCCSEDDRLLVFQDVLLNALPGSTLTERQDNVLRFDLPGLSSSSIRMSYLVRNLEDLKDRRSPLVDGYAIRQGDMEQVIANLTHQSENPVAEQHSVTTTFYDAPESSPPTERNQAAEQQRYEI